MRDFIEKRFLSPLIVPDTKNITNGDKGEEDDDLDEEEEFDWQIEQEPYSEINVAGGGPTYGFAGQKSGLLGRMQSELHDVVDLKNADNTPESERRGLRIQDESDHFDDDHYL